MWFSAVLPELGSGTADFDFEEARPTTCRPCCSFAGKLFYL